MDLLPHGASDGRVQPRHGQALDLIDKIRRRQLPGALVQEVGQTVVDPGQVRGLKIQITGSSRCIPRKGGTGLIKNPGPDADQVLAV